MNIQSPANFIRIIEGCKSNDRLSQKALYQHFYGYCMSVSFRYVRDRDDALEIINSAFTKVFMSIDKYDLEKPFKPWLRRILVNCAIDHLRIKKKIGERTDIETMPQLGREETITGNLAYEEILKLIHQLSPSYRAVFNLFVIEGFKHEEIAEMLGISTGTSKSNLFKAKAHLRAALLKLNNNER